jgi:hypothetical protein
LELSDDDNDDTQPRPASASAKRAHVIDSDDDRDAESTSKAKKLRTDASASTEVIEIDSDEPAPKPKETAQEELGGQVLHHLHVNCSVCTHAFLGRLSKGWDVPIYAFFEPVPEIKEIEMYDKAKKKIVKRRCHEFKCTAQNCLSKGALGRGVRRFLDTDDKTSTSNLRKHAWKCWGKKLVQDAEATKDLQGVRKGLKNTRMKDGALTAVFERVGKGKVSYSHVPHTYEERRCVASCGVLSLISDLCLVLSASVGLLKPCVLAQ